MISFQKKNFGLIRRYPIVGGRRLSNYWWSVVIFLGGCGFLLTGISSYFNRNLLLVTPKLENLENPMHTRPAYSISWGCSASIPQVGSTATFGMQRFHLHTEGKASRDQQVPKEVLHSQYPFEACQAGVSNFNGYTKPTEKSKEQQVIPSTREKSKKKYPLKEDILTDLPNALVDIPKGTKLFHSCKTRSDCSSSGMQPFRLLRISQDMQAKPLWGLRSWKDLSIFSETWVNKSFEEPQSAFSTLAQHPKENKDGFEVINGVPNLAFFPQGLVLSFYGFFGLCFSFHLWLTLIWKIGAGFNEFNGKDKQVRIFRWGRPGKNRRIDVKYTKELIETLKIELVPKPALFLHIKGEKDIPLTNAALIGEFIPLEDLETQATELTSLLQIPLEIAD